MSLRRIVSSSAGGRSSDRLRKARSAATSGTHGSRLTRDRSSSSGCALHVVALVLRGLDLLRMFDVVALTTRGGPGIATETLTYYIYNLAFKFFDLGYGAAAAILMLVGVSVLVTLAIRILTRQEAA